MEEGKHPLVSAIMTTYRRPEAVVRRALDSIMAQDYPQLEVFLVNDCPEEAGLVESLRHLCLSYSSSRPVNYIVVDHNGGACKARNLAIRQARGTYVACLDDDDEWLPDKIGAQVAVAENGDAIDLVYCEAELLYDQEPSRRGSLLGERPLPSGNIFSQLLSENFIGSCSFPLIRRQALLAVGGFDEAMPALQDWELYLRLAKRGSAACCSQPLARYHFHAGDRISAHPQGRTDAYERIHREFAEDLDGDPSAAAGFYRMGTYFYSILGDGHQAMAYYRRSVRLKPFDLKRNIKDFFRMTLRPLVRKRIV
ncbi:glycosyltransferase family 2 protein [Bifidobacterium aemilianum]|nr:glycosyltransferase [Bifidobacterium aemilianum]